MYKLGTNYREVFLVNYKYGQKTRRIAMEAKRFHRSEGIKCQNNVVANMVCFLTAP